MSDWKGRERWEQVLAIASLNHSYIGFNQLTETIGYSTDEVRGLVRCMKLERSLRGFYRVAAAEQTWRSRLHLYTLATNGVASGCSAGLLLGLIEPKNSPVKAAELWVPRRSRVDNTRVQAARCSDFDQLDITLVENTPCTTVDRTLVDIAATQRRHVFLDCYNVALRRKMTTLDSLRRVASADTRRRGRRQLDEAIASLVPTDRPAQSEWSLWAERRLVAAGLPPPLLEHRVCDSDGFPIAAVDLYWPQFLVALELDGRPYHDRHEAFERDRARDAQLAAAGIVVVRMTWEQYRQPGYLVRIMTQVLEQRGWIRAA